LKLVPSGITRSFGTPAFRRSSRRTATAAKANEAHQSQ
jgi:hypothetical protein